MDENKVVNLFDFKRETDEKPVSKKAFDFSFQTNPILQRMLLCSNKAKKHKFRLQDLFK